MKFYISIDLIHVLLKQAILCINFQFIDLLIIL